MKFIKNSFGCFRMYFDYVSSKNDFTCEMATTLNILRTKKYD
ncbi:hypothetical protein RintRC_2574 [Richelia intracellularis]|nr:hypothetical protein RintRC_2574 [Richelia intracellularis]